MLWAIQWVAVWFVLLAVLSLGLALSTPETITYNLSFDAAADLAKLGRFTPAFRDGHYLGVKVLVPPPTSELERGDLLLAVNGMRLNELDNGMGFYTTLKAASRFELSLERDGRLQHLTYVLRPQREESTSHPSTSAPGR